MEYLILNEDKPKKKKGKRIKKNRKERKKRYIVSDEIGRECNRCGMVMERREHITKPNKTWYYTKWDYCSNGSCGKTVQHYDEFKSEDWKEAQRQDDFLGSI